MGRQAGEPNYMGKWVDGFMREDRESKSTGIIPINSLTLQLINRSSGHIFYLNNLLVEKGYAERY